MNRRLFIGASLTAGGAVFLSGCSLFYPSASLRYRMTVEVDTSEGVKTGSSIIEVTISDGPGMGDASGISFDLKGEAVAVDLPGGRTLFALLSGIERASPADYHAYLFTSLLRAGVPTTPPMPRRYGQQEWAKVFGDARRLKPMMVVPPKLERYPDRVKKGEMSPYPLLVTFTDIRDPKTVARVDPDDMAKSFGAGVTLRRITLQVTDDPVTTGIEKRLAWLRNHRGTLKPDPPMYMDNANDPNTRLLGTGSFSTEIFK
jgi:hypothetical protein